MSYSTVAVKAAKLAANEKINPVEAWEHCAKNEFPVSEASQKKSCPKNTFLGLCEEGLVKGIPVGKYTRSVENKRYALNAIKILSSNKNSILKHSELWKEVLKLEADKNKKANSQMTVVLALWEKNMIKIK